METKLPPSDQMTLPLASFSVRFIASLIDWVILLLPGFLIQFPFSAIGLSFLYFPIFHASSLRATPGKKAFGIQVVTTNGGTIGFPAAFFRHIVELASACFACLGHLAALFTKRKQAVHDLVAETIVVEAPAGTASLWDAWLQSMRQLFNFEVGSSKMGKPSVYDRQRRLDELERLHGLREKGVISDDEYQRLRKDLL